MMDNQQEMGLWNIEAQTAQEKEVRKQGKVAGEEKEYTGAKAQDRGQHTHTHANPWVEIPT